MTKIHSFRIRIMGPDLDTYDTPQDFDNANQKMVNDYLRHLGAISNIEDAINDELPEGFYCEIEDE